MMAFYETFHSAYFNQFLKYGHPRYHMAPLFWHRVWKESSGYVVIDYLGKFIRQYRRLND